MAMRCMSGLVAHRDLTPLVPEISSGGAGIPWFRPRWYGTVFALRVASDDYARKSGEFDQSPSQSLMARPLRVGLVGLAPRAAVRRGHSATIPRATAVIDVAEPVFNPKVDSHPRGSVTSDKQLRRDHRPHLPGVDVTSPHTQMVTDQPSVNIGFRRHVVDKSVRASWGDAVSIARIRLRSYPIPNVGGCQASQRPRGSRRS